jgi:hypothetical protein
VGGGFHEKVSGCQAPWCFFGVPRFEFFCDQDRDSPGFHAHSDELIRLEFGDLPGSDIVDAAIFATLSRQEQAATRSHPDGAIPGR